MYHNGFQLSIPPNTVPPPFTPVHFTNTTNSGTSPSTGQVVQSVAGAYNLLTNTSITAAVAAVASPATQQQVIQDFPKTVRGRPRKIIFSRTGTGNTTTTVPSTSNEVDSKDGIYLLPTTVTSESTEDALRQQKEERIEIPVIFLKKIHTTLTICYEITFKTRQLHRFNKQFNKTSEAIETAVQGMKMQVRIRRSENLVNEE
ncbi:uncharacterized protein [Eurosta solidaginis]|uniref:uncharacterized protein n=1 Tax=Eurosta solidaginis TaxID=178769 RepID=UPI003530BE4D